MVLLASATAIFALPNCPSDQTKRYHNCFGTYTFASGDVYVGEFKDSKKDGQGTYTFANGGTYAGEWIGDKNNGQGTFTFADGGTYVGEWKDGKKNGQATYTYADGSKYVGEFKDNKWNGLGFFILKSGEADFCVYVDDEESNCSGSDVYDVAPILTNNFRQLSEFKRKKIQQNLKSIDLYTSVIDGKWGRGTFSALASYAALNLNTVTINNASSANTLFERVLGSSSLTTGSCPADQSAYWDNCTGKITFDDGSTYVGEFSDNRFSGQGTYTFSDGENYVGEWKDGKNNGQGTYTFASGAKFVGEFRNDIKNGQGTYTYADGTIKEGIWKDGELQNAQISPKVVETDDPNETREVASGTGFYVSNEGHIITNYHVIDGCMDMKVHTKGRVIPTLRIADDELNDLALLKISETPSHVFALSNDSPFPLQEIVVAGFPFGESYSSSLKFTQGIISSLTGIGNNYSEMQIDAALQPGNSGGPIIDEYGNIVGVAVAKLDAKYTLDNFGVIPENTNFGIKASAVKNLLEGNQVPLKAPTTELISKRDLSRLATDGTVYLTCWMTSAQLEQMKSKKVIFGHLD